MRRLDGPIWDQWNAGGPFIGTNRAHGRVTVEFGWSLRASSGPVGDIPAAKLPIRWFQRIDNSQVETELPNVKTININRSIDQDAAECDIDLYNQQMLPAQLAELGNPGYFTFGRGSHPDALARWGHTPTPWSNELTPNALLRTYEGFGGYYPDGTPMPIPEALAAGYIEQTGLWLIDEVRPGTDGMLHIKARDVAKLLVDQPIYPPLVPAGLYPLDYERFKYQHIVTPYIAYGTAAGGTKIIVGAEVDAGGDGYWLAGDDGGIFTYGNNFFYGSLAGDIEHGVIGMARTPTGKGYWVTAKDGTTFAFGDATFHGGWTSGVCVAIERAGPLDGYYLLDEGGGVYTFGDAPFYGSGPGASTIVAMAVMPDGTGYWILDSTGHVYAYGSAGYYGNGDPSNPSPYTGIETTPTGLGYYLVTKKGHVYAFGDAVYHGGAQGIVLNDPISDIIVRPDGAGYWLIAEDGGVFTYGDIGFYGALPGSFASDARLDGNYFDYCDIVRDLLLWAGFWAYAVDSDPYVFGSIEASGTYAPDPLPPEMFSQQPVIAAITKIKEILGYVLWVDSIGAVHFESPNWWSEGNFLPDGTRTNVLPQIDERVQLISYATQEDDKDAVDRVIIANVDPTAGTSGTVTTTVIPPTAPILRGILKPVLWFNEVATDPADQAAMGTLLGNQLVFNSRAGAVVCVANPNIELNDQVRIWERQTDEVYDHYVRGIATSHDLDEGVYTMQVTTHWLGRDWSGPGPRRNVLAGSVRSAENVSEGFTVSVTAPMADTVSAELVEEPLVAFAQTPAAADVVTGESFGQPLILQTIVQAGGAVSASVVPAVGLTSTVPVASASTGETVSLAALGVNLFAGTAGSDEDTGIPYVGVPDVTVGSVVSAETVGVVVVA